MDDGTTICHYLDGKCFVNGVEYGSKVITFGGGPALLTSNPEYLCYPLTWNNAYIGSYGRHISSRRKERAQSRIERRKERKKERRREQFNNRTRTCHTCGGTERWCSCCEVFSCHGSCNDGWGTCMCS